MCIERYPIYALTKNLITVYPFSHIYDPRNTVHCAIASYSDLNCFGTEMGRYNKYRTKQYTHAQTHLHTHTHTHTSWWLVLGRATTKEYHLRLLFDHQTSTYGASTNVYNNNNNNNKYHILLSSNSAEFSNHHRN